VHARLPGQRAGLTRSAVFSAAHDLLRDAGPEGLTMRALATRLHVAPNALYSHVASKTALVDQLLDDLLGEVEAPPADADNPAHGLENVMASTYRVLFAHPELVPLYLTRQGSRGPQAERLGGVMTALLAEAGVGGRANRAALRVLLVYTIGFAAFTTQAGPVIGPQQPPDKAELAANFTAGLRWLLVGITHQGQAC